MLKVWKRKRRSVFYTLMTDVLFNLLAFYMLMVGVKSAALITTQVAAARVPGLEDKVQGLEGQLEDAQEDLIFAHKQGAEFRSVIEDQEIKIGHLEDQFQLVSSEKAGLETELGLLADELGGVKITLGQQEQTISEYEDRFRAGPPVTIVVVIDVTASMQPAIDELLTALSTLFESLPTKSEDFRCGIVAFRNGVVAEYPVTPILAHYDDNYSSQKSILHFVESLKASSAWTKHLPAFQRATQMFQEAHAKADAKRKERLIFIGDVGPSELDGRPGYSSEERSIKSRIHDGIKTWVRQGNRAVASLYVESESTRQDPSRQESHTWFEALGNVTPTSNFYTATSELLRAMQKATRE